MSLEPPTWPMKVDTRALTGLNCEPAHCGALVARLKVAFTRSSGCGPVDTALCWMTEVNLGSESKWTLHCRALVVANIKAALHCGALDVAHNKAGRELKDNSLQN